MKFILSKSSGYRGLLCQLQMWYRMYSWEIEDKTVKLDPVLAKRWSKQQARVCFSRKAENFWCCIFSFGSMDETEHRIFAECLWYTFWAWRYCGAEMGTCVFSGANGWQLCLWYSRCRVAGRQIHELWQGCAIFGKPIQNSIIEYHRRSFNTNWLNLQFLQTL